MRCTKSSTNLIAKSYPFRPFYCFCRIRASAQLHIINSGSEKWIGTGQSRSWLCMPETVSVFWYERCCIWARLKVEKVDLALGAAAQAKQNLFYKHIRRRRGEREHIYKKYYYWKKDEEWVVGCLHRRRRSQHEWNREVKQLPELELSYNFTPLFWSVSSLLT